MMSSSSAPSFTSSSTPAGAEKEIALRTATTTTEDKTETESSKKTASRGKRSLNGANRKKSVLLLFGSNMGTCEDLSRRLSTTLSGLGFISRVQDLDHAVENEELPRDGTPVIITTSSYNGNPPDNACEFANMLELKESTNETSFLKGVRFAVLGVGDPDWEQTYQQFPKIVDGGMSHLGAERILSRGVCNAATSLEDDFEAWSKMLISVLLGEGESGAETPEKGPMAEKKENEEKTKMMPVTSSSGEGSYIPAIAVKMIQTEASAQAEEVAGGGGNRAEDALQRILPKNALLGEVLANEELQSPESERSTRHIEIQLPPGASYRAGDHLAVYPENPSDLVESICRDILKLPPSTICEISAARSSGSAASASSSPISSPRSSYSLNGLPLNCPVTIGRLLSSFVDLAGPPTVRQLQILAEKCEAEAEKSWLKKLSGDPVLFAREISSYFLSIAELVKMQKSLVIDPATLLDILSPLKCRFYSISSSPLRESSRCSITVGVVKRKKTASGGKDFQGLTSSYLSTRAVKSELRIFVKDSGTLFRPPPADVPLIMIGPGTGLAPMIGFLEEREAALQSSSASARKKDSPSSGSPGENADLQQTSEQHSLLAPSELFFGCRGEQDFIYRGKVQGFVARGILSHLHVAFSRTPSQPKKYVQDFLLENGARVWTLIHEKKAQIMVCGDASKMAPDVTRTFMKIATEFGKMTPTEAEAYVLSLKGLQEGRYKEDVWSSGG